jgi:hypothetical protein
MTDVLYGQCVCGASLTIWHTCPLRPQQERAFVEEELSEAIKAVFAARHEVSHVAVLGEN